MAATLMAAVHDLYVMDDALGNQKAVIIHDPAIIGRRAAAVGEFAREPGAIQFGDGRLRRHRPDAKCQDQAKYERWRKFHAMLLLFRGDPKAFSRTGKLL